MGQATGLHQTDSLKHLLSLSKQDTSRVLILAELTEAYRNVRPDSAMLYGQQALNLARESNFPTGEIEALLSISVVQRELGNLPYALNVALKALKITQEHQIEQKEAGCLVRVANVYLASKNFAKALSYYQQAEKIRRNYYGDEWGLAVTQMFIGDVYEQMNQLDSALYYEQLVFQKMFHIKGENLQQNVFRVLGNIQAKKGNNHLALAYYQQGIQAALRSIDYRSASTIYNNVATFYKKLNRPDSAIYYAKQGLAYGEMLSYQNRIMAASSLLAELYEPQDAKEALRFYKIASAAKDSLYGAERVQALQSLSFEEQERLREIEQARIEYQSKIRQYALLAGLAVILTIALLLYRNNLHKQRANALLKRQKEEIISQKGKLQETLDNLKDTQTQLIQSEKMASLGELTAGIAHEIQNPLNFVNNFSAVSSELVEELEQEALADHKEDVLTIAADLRQNLSKIHHHGRRADAIVKNMLQHSRTTAAGEKQLTNLNALTDEYLRLAYHGFRAKDKSFTCTLDTFYDLKLEKVEVVPQDLGRVLLNLYNNAFYAVQQKVKMVPAGAGGEEEAYKPTVTVSTHQREGQVEIRVRDNGTGMPESVKQKIFQPFFTTKPTGEGTGLGLSLSYDIITKGHGGELMVKSGEGAFTELSIVIPFAASLVQLAPSADEASLTL
ncbi:hypothetical protein BH24BAC1_BH24BAC1_33920 [soil metagenome]